MTNRELIERYNEAWNDHDLDAVLALHTPGMVFENHTAGERASGDEVRRHIAGILASWPDLRFKTGRLLEGPGHAVCEWTAEATHERPLRRAGRVAKPTGRLIPWRGVDVFTIRDGRIARKDVYSDSVAILRAAGLMV